MGKVLSFAHIQSSFFSGPEKKGRLILIKNRPSLNAKEFLNPPHFRKGGFSFREFIIHDYTPEAIFQFPFFCGEKIVWASFILTLEKSPLPPTFYYNIF